MTRLLQRECPICGAPVIPAQDLDTDEVIVADVDRVDEGRIRLWAIKEHAFARRYGTPARLQPAWREHACAVAQAKAPAEDPYEDASPAAQQHGGWRA